MKTQTFTAFLTVLALFLSACNSTIDLKEDEVYTIINEIIADNSLIIKRVCWEFQDIKMTDEYAKEFTKQDIEFIGLQQEIFKNTKIKPESLKWFQPINKTYVYASVDTNCDQGIIYHISFPFISADRQKVILEFHEDCNCLLGGQGSRNLYERKNNHWVRTKSFDHWISENRNFEEKKQLLVTNAIANAGLRVR
jgi:hypothetical protein